MTRSEALTTFAALAVGRAIWHSQASVAAPLLGSMLTTNSTSDVMALAVLRHALAAADKDVTETGADPFTVKEFYAEVRRIARSDEGSDVTVRAMMESGTKLSFVTDSDIPVPPGKAN